MKIAIATSGKSLDAPFAAHFGWAENFIIFDTTTTEWNAYPNPAPQARNNVGVLAVQFLVDHNVQAVMSGNFGPAATNALAAAGIQMYSATPTVGKVLSDYQEGKLSRVLPSVEVEAKTHKAMPDPVWGGY